MPYADATEVIRDVEAMNGEPAKDWPVEHKFGNSKLAFALYTLMLDGCQQDDWSDGNGFYVCVIEKWLLLIDSDGFVGVRELPSGFYAQAALDDIRRESNA